MHRYEPDYFAHFAGGAARSADVVLPLVKAGVRIGSVADFGCGRGAWLAAWQRLGVVDVVGCDGPHIDTTQLLFHSGRFVAADLAAAVHVGRRVDLVQSLEVAEHLPADAAPVFVHTLVSHAPVVLFSAAPPGQGGEHHVNERPLEYWRALFRQHGFQPIDALRPQLVGDRRVEPWYRYNTILFVDESSLSRLDSSFRARLVPDGMPLREYAPPAVRFHREIVRHLPEPLVTGVAVGLRRIKGRWRASSRRSAVSRIG